MKRIRVKLSKKLYGDRVAWSASGDSSVLEGLVSKLPKKLEEQASAHGLSSLSIVSTRLWSLNLRNVCVCVCRCVCVSGKRGGGGGGGGARGILSSTGLRTALVVLCRSRTTDCGWLEDEWEVGESIMLGYCDGAQSSLDGLALMESYVERCYFSAILVLFVELSRNSFH